MSLPSKIGFVSLLQYSPRGTNETAKDSRRIRDAIKRDSYIRVRMTTGVVKNMRAIEFYAGVMRTLVERWRGQFPFLAEMFGADVVLVPMPRSAPLSNPSALWTPMRIYMALKAEGLGGEILPILKRVRAVQKSAFAGPGERPGPKQHYDSMTVTGLGELPIFSSQRIVLVDDFITRGATFIGAYPHIEAAFPAWQIRCFALVRTQSYDTISEIRAPVQGVITLRHDKPRRTP